MLAQRPTEQSREFAHEKCRARWRSGACRFVSDILKHAPHLIAELPAMSCRVKPQKSLV